MEQTAVEWLAERYNYVTWLRNRDEISAEMADGFRKKYLEQANEMFKDQIIKTFEIGYENGACVNEGKDIYHGSNYYNQTFKSE